MIGVRLDSRLSGAPLAVARAVRNDVARVTQGDLLGTVYLGVGSADLVRPEDGAPHVVVPLTRGRRLDAVEQQQIAGAAGVVAMDQAEAGLVARFMTRGAVLVIASANTPATRSVIQTGNPFDAAEVEDFLAACPRHAHALRRHAVPLLPFTPRPITLAAIEALYACIDSPQ